MRGWRPLLLSQSASVFMRSRSSALTEGVNSAVERTVGRPAGGAWCRAIQEPDKRIRRHRGTSTVPALYTREFATILSRGGAWKHARSRGIMIILMATRSFRLLFNG